MSEPTPSPSEAVLLAFLTAYEEATREGRAFDVESWYVRYPHFADEMRRLVETQRGLAPSPPVEPTPARLSDYRLIQKIAVGGMGEVWDAVQETLGRRVAVKIIHPLRVSDEAKQRFHREQTVLARLHHTHIVPIHDGGQQQGLQFFVMPFINGAALHHVVWSAWQRETSGPADNTPMSLVELLPAPPPVVENQSVTVSELAQVTGLNDVLDLAAKKDPEMDQRMVKLDEKYLRSVAAAVADVAEALHHAHASGIVHRDVKPSNIMLDRTGQCWVIDFGLSGYSSPIGRRADRVQLDERGNGTIGGAKGTPPYMAPEQFKGHADARSDVWGLGATLYELITLRKAFPGKSSQECESLVETQNPAAPQSLANIPDDLAAICRRALRKDASERYQTAQAFADDLRRWLRWEPTAANPPNPLRRAGMWGRRNPGWAAALALVIVLLAWGAVFWITRYRALEVATIRQNIERQRLSLHTDGWSKKVWEAVGKAAESDKSLDMRNLAVASLQGIDATKAPEPFSFSASSVAFHPDGKQLVMGGTNESEDELPQLAHYWDGVNAPIESKLTGEGPVAFVNGKPLQLVAQKEKLVLWDIMRQSAVREIDLKFDPKKPIRSRQLAISANGVYIGAASDSGKWTRIWDVQSGREVRSWNEVCLALAISPDGKYAACSDLDGSVKVWPLPAGEVVAHLRRDRANVQALAFGVDVRRKPTAARPGRGWLLATGDDAGNLTVWDIEDGTIRSLSRGSDHHVHAVAFSPDGMTFASAGRHVAKLWDIATGNFLLDASENNWLTGVAFSPDGRTLAVSSLSVFRRPGYKGRVDLWTLETGRGIRSLRGLSAHPEKVVFSPDDRLVAGLSHDSRIAVWDVASERLLNVFDAPRALWTDNAAILFSPDSKQLAFAGSHLNGGRAMLWNIADGTEIAKWEFNKGYQNQLAFHKEKGLILFQTEGKEEVAALGKMYHLRTGQKIDELWSIKEFDVKMRCCQFANNGGVLVLVGYFKDGKQIKHRIMSYTAVSGQVEFASAAESDDRHVQLYLDEKGRSVYVARSNQIGKILELPSGKTLPSPPLGQNRMEWSADRPYQTAGGHGKLYPQFGHNALCLHAHNNSEPIFVLGFDVSATGTLRSFSSDGQRYAWGRADGTVSVLDFHDVHRRLKTIRLEW